jgi:hypothetical protein
MRKSPDLKPGSRLLFGAGLLINSSLALGCLALSLLGGFESAAAIVLTSLLLAIATWATYNAILFGFLALRRSSSFHASIDEQKMIFHVGGNEHSFVPAEIVRYVCYSDKIILHHPGRTGVQYLPFVRGKADRTILRTYLLAGGQMSARGFLSEFDPAFDRKQSLTLGALLSWLSP